MLIATPSQSMLTDANNNNNAANNLFSNLPSFSQTLNTSASGTTGLGGASALNFSQNVNTSASGTTGLGTPSDIPPLPNVIDQKTNDVQRTSIVFSQNFTAASSQATGPTAPRAPTAPTGARGLTGARGSTTATASTVSTTTYDIPQITV